MLHYAAISRRQLSILASSFRRSHHSLSTFLSYAAQNSLSRTSTVYLGTHYEYTVLTSLVALSLQTHRTGGSHDLGIDLLGSWSLPHLAQPLKVFVQCKRTATTRALQIRELQGSFVGVPEAWKGEGCLGLLVTASEATKGLRDALVRSDLPMCHVVCTPEGELKGMRWNRKAEEYGLEGVSVGMTYTSKGTKEVRLLYKGASIASGQICE